MDSMELICCLCNFEAAEDEELTHHIDSVHSEIFRICNDFGAPQNLSAQGNASVPLVNLDEVFEQETFEPIRTNQRSSTTPTTSRGRGLGNERTTIGQVPNAVKENFSPITSQSAPAAAVATTDRGKTRSRRSTGASGQVPVPPRTRSTTMSQSSSSQMSQTVNITTQSRKRRSNGRVEANATAAVAGNADPVDLKRAKLSSDDPVVRPERKNEEEELRKAEIIQLNQKLSELQQQLDAGRHENVKLKQDFEEVNNAFAQLKSKNSNLEEKLAASDSSKAKVESQKEDLTNQILESEKKLGDLTRTHDELRSKHEEALKAKNTELCRRKLSEGRLQIEVNKLTKENAIFNERFDAVIGKFKQEVERLKAEFDVTKADAGRYKRIKNVFDKVLKADDNFCLTGGSPDSFDDENEFVDLIEAYLVESVETRIEQMMEFKRAIDKMSDYQNTRRTNNFLIDRMTANLEKSTETIKSLRSETSKLQAENKDLKLNTTTLQKYGKNLKEKAAAKEKVFSNLKMEVFELDRLASKVCEEKSRLEADKADLEISVAALRNELKANEKELRKTIVSMQNDLKLKEINETELKANFEATLKKEIDAKNKALKRSSESLKKTAQDLEKCKADLDDKCRSLDAMSKTIESLQSELGDLSQLTETLKEKNNNFLYRELDSIIDVAKLKQEVKNGQDEVAELKSELEKASKNKDKARARALEDMKSEIEELEKAFVKSEAENKKLTAKQKELLGKIESSKEVTNKREAELQKKVKDLKKLQTCYDQLKSAKSDEALENQIKVMRGDLKDKEKLIKALQRNNDIVDADLEKMTQEKNSLEVKLKSLEDEAERKAKTIRDEYFGALKKHSEVLNRFKSEVESSMNQKDEEIAKLKTQLQDQDSRPNPDNEAVCEDLRSRLLELESKIEDAQKESEERSRDLAECTRSKKEMARKMAEAERQISNLEEKLKMEEEKSVKNLTRSARISELVNQVQIVEIENKKLAKQIQDKEDQIDKMNKEVVRKSIEVEKLVNEVASVSDQIKNLESEKRQSRMDMVWAQNFCLSQEKQIKDLEEKLSRLAPQPDQSQPDQQQQETDPQSPAEPAQPPRPLMLKIRKDLT